MSDARAPGVKPAGLDALDGFSVDDDLNLYWHERRVVTQSRLVLSFWQRLGTFLGVLSALSLAIFDILRFFGFGWHP